MNRMCRRLAGLLAALGICLFWAGRGEAGLPARLADRPPEERMRRVRLLTAEAAAPPSAPPASPEPRTLKELLRMTPQTTLPPAMTPEPDTAVETAIEGGMRIRNGTAYWVDAARLLADGPGLSLPADEPQILIIHTHASEAYTPAGEDRYIESDERRTEDTQYNVVRIGDELTAILNEAGLNVIHDRGIYDYPSYTGSYSRAGAAIGQYLKSCPGIRVVLDVHRGSLGAGGVVYKTMAEEDGAVASQITLVVGTDESGLEHPAWRGNLALAVYLQNAVNSALPTLMRPIELVPQRYNQHFTPGSLTVEVGSSGNTLREALTAVRLFARAAAPALRAIVEE